MSGRQCTKQVPDLDQTGSFKRVQAHCELILGVVGSLGHWGTLVALCTREEVSHSSFAAPIEAMSSPARKSAGKRGPLSVLDYLFVDNEDGLFVCVFCGHPLKSSNGQRHGGNAWSHLRSAHYDLLKLLLQQAPSRLAKSKDLEVDLALGSAGAVSGQYSAELTGSTLTVSRIKDPSAPPKKRGIAAFAVPQHEIEAAKQATFGVRVKNALVRFVCATGQPFNVVQSPSFRRFCETLVPTYSGLRLNSRGVIVRGMAEMVTSIKGETKTLLSNSPVVALSSDMWSSVRSYLPLMSFGGYFLRDGLVDFRILDIRCPDGGDAAALAQEIDAVVSDYGIGAKAASLTTDGEAKMKSIVDESDYLDRHLTCLAHSLTLCVKHVMMKKDKEHTHVSRVVGRMERLIRFFHDSSTATHRLQQMQVASPDQIDQLLDDLGLGRGWDESEVDDEELKEVRQVSFLGNDVGHHPDEEGIVFVEEEEEREEGVFDDGDDFGDDDGDDEEDVTQDVTNPVGGTTRTSTTMSISSSDDEGGSAEEMSAARSALSALRSTASRVLDLTEEPGASAGPSVGPSLSGLGGDEEGGEGTVVEQQAGGAGSGADQGRRKKGLRLLRPCPTRWISRLRAIIRFLLLWPFVRVIVHAANKKRSQKKKLPVLTQAEITFLQMIVVLLTPMYGFIIHVQTMAPQALKSKRLLTKLEEFYRDPTGAKRAAEKSKARDWGSPAAHSAQSRRQVVLNTFESLISPGSERRRRQVCFVPAQKELMATVLEAVERSNDRLRGPPVQQKFDLKFDPEDPRLVELVEAKVKDGVPVEKAVEMLVGAPFVEWSTQAPTELMRLIKTHVLGEGLGSFSSTGTSGASQSLSLKWLLKSGDKSYRTIQMASFFNIVTARKIEMDAIKGKTVTFEVRDGDFDARAVLWVYMEKQIRKRVEEEARKRYPLPEEEGSAVEAVEEEDGLGDDDSLGGKRGRALSGVFESEPLRKKGPGAGVSFGDVSDDELDFEEFMENGGGSVDTVGGEGSSSTSSRRSTIYTGAAHATQFEDEVAAAQGKQRDYVARTMEQRKDAALDALDYFESKKTREVIRDLVALIRLRVDMEGELTEDDLGLLGFNADLFFWSSVLEGCDPIQLALQPSPAFDAAIEAASTNQDSNLNPRTLQDSIKSSTAEYNLGHLRVLAPFAVELLLSPLCSTADERLFTQATMSFTRQRLGIKSANACKQLFLRANLHLKDKEEEPIGRVWDAARRVWHGGITREEFRSRCRDVRNEMMAFPPGTTM